ncbi:Hypothetical predicted protein, partial [Pelobates cultripes]
MEQYTELVHDIQSTPKRSPLTDYNMVWKSLKSQAGALKETRDIGTLLQRPQGPKMASGPERIS